MDRPRIVIIGSGNVASHLAPALSRVADVVQVASRNHGHAAALAGKLPCAAAAESVDSIVTDADFYIIAVSDDSVGDVAASMPEVKGIVAHTSGSVPVEALSRHSRRGVFYPLQTFSVGSKVDIAEVPFLIEGTDAATASDLKALASRLSPTVVDADSALRSRIHVAAVFACNFPNFMWTCARNLLNDAGLDLGLMRPLLHASLDKALDMGPEQAQTGPARRGDSEVIERHIASLPSSLAEIYRMLSNQIVNHYKPTSYNSR